MDGYLFFCCGGMFEPVTFFLIPVCVWFVGQVRVAALQCLVKIMSLFYQHMKHYMGPALFAVSKRHTVVVSYSPFSLPVPSIASLR